jgi:hypothetical protein
METKVTGSELMESNRERGQCSSWTVEPAEEEEEEEVIFGEIQLGPMHSTLNIIMVIKSEDGKMDGTYSTKKL